LKTLKKGHVDLMDVKDCEKFLEDRSKLFCLYIFLRRSAILFRETPPNSPYKGPLHQLINFLSNKENAKNFKKHLRVKSFLYSGDYWGTGLHEWLTCKDTIVALRRTAGLRDKDDCIYPPAESHIKPIEGIVRFGNGAESNFLFHEFNWLDFQFLIRTATKHTIYLDLSGHPGAINRAIVPAKNGYTKGHSPKVDLDRKFHGELNSKFHYSRSIYQYMHEVFLIFENKLLHDKTNQFTLSNERACFSNGMLANEHNSVCFFKQKKLKKSHDDMHFWYRDILVQVCLSELSHNDKMVVTYAENNLVPIGKDIQKAQSVSLLTLQIKR
jgi:hypothetical protein